MRVLRKASRSVRAQPGEAKAAGVHEVRQFEGEVRVAGGGESGSSGGQREGQGEREGGGDLTARRREMQEEEDDGEGHRGRRRDRGGGRSVPVEVRFQHRTIPGADGQVNSRGGGDDWTDGPDRGLHAVCIPVQRPTQCQPRNVFEECRFFTSEFVMSEEESEEEVDPEEIDQELGELQKDLEEQEGPVPE